jgi:hypothetical protein
MVPTPEKHSVRRRQIPRLGAILFLNGRRKLEFPRERIGRTHLVRSEKRSVPNNAFTGELKQCYGVVPAHCPFGNDGVLPVAASENGSL